MAELRRKELVGGDSEMAVCEHLLCKVYVVESSAMKMFKHGPRFPPLYHACGRVNVDSQESNGAPSLEGTNANVLVLDADGQLRRRASLSSEEATSWWQTVYKGVPKWVSGGAPACCWWPMS